MIPISKLEHDRIGQTLGLRHAVSLSLSIIAPVATMARLLIY